MKPTVQQSLSTALQHLSKKWALIGLALTAAVSLPFFFYLSMHSAETRISTLTQAVARAFRPMILDKNIRDAQFQMKRTLGLSEGEYVVVRDPDYKTIYANDLVDIPNKCKTPGKPCWDLISGYVTYLQPVYFNDDLKESLFGYVELRTNNPQNWPLLSVFLVFLGVVFSIIALGLSSTQQRTVSLIKDTMDKWAKRIKETPTNPQQNSLVPFTEMTTVDQAVSKLHLDIARLTEIAARDARMKTQLTMVKEIGHDLKTPYSQITKFLTVLAARANRTGLADPVLLKLTQRSLERMGDILRQIQVIGPGLHNSGVLLEGCDPSHEAAEFVNDLKKTPDFHVRGIEVTCTIETNSAFAKIPKVQFYRIIDNLVRNSLDAVENNTGRIEILVSALEGYPTLTVKDNGAGIPTEHLNKIFDGEFTTKPARGTGLGLTIVKKLCDDFEATIAVNSALSVGTEFRIQFQPEAEPRFQESLREMSV
ncbi:MAG: sensor histidine kinase [Bacteriovoracia bacterium]